MLLIDDLRLEAEILPPFNFTHCHEAEQALGRVLRELPSSVARVEEKQAVFRALLAQWDVIGEFSYSRIQLPEVQRFLHEVVSGQLTLETSRVRLAARLLLSEEARYRSRARYVQAVQFLRRLEEFYFRRLDPAGFPPFARVRLTAIIRFLERFSLESAAGAIAEDRFSAGRMVDFARQLHAVEPAELAEFWAAVFWVEACWSVAKGLREQQFVFPEFQPAGLELTGFYHPLLTAPVKNTLTLSPDDNVVLLTGPNMSGKSTLLKAVGLCVYLAHAGLGVPASAARLPFYASIVVAINLTDSLSSGYSHFLAEIRNLKGVLAAAQGPGRVFAVFDELFRGTNVDDALDITRATVSGLAGFPGSCFLISTHLLQLESQLPAQSGRRAFCIACTLHNGVPVFSYRLQVGWSSLKIGRILFEHEGLPELLRPLGATTQSSSL
ncbi:MutS-related protein [Hymenobacter rubripertinctus]|uniref:DNA mismatch repair proteins mutS family domain-containing protein n=1 Tax=Hymenobacter rubripertinctus TaxID=2029981 RepID=A0A418QKY7_9BACT|nr:hypothetical protein [Hymenobacter rubripertinctus]RIY05792.1 hypothetical protein D0T11_19860 [Hymenobacter rubripertinctus]